jgi:hypothetical protein
VSECLSDPTLSVVVFIVHEVTKSRYLVHVDVYNTMVRWLG